MEASLPQPLLVTLSNVVLRSPVVFKPLFTTALTLMDLPLSARFASYAMEFERALRTDRWNRVAVHFAVEAVYEVKNMGLPDARMSGRGAIIAGFRRSLNGFDRKLERRISLTEAPREQGDTLTFVWVGIYSRPTSPPLEVSARSTATFERGLITHLVDDYLPRMDAGAWLRAHGADLDPAYVAGRPVAVDG